MRSAFLDRFGVAALACVAIACATTAGSVFAEVIEVKLPSGQAVEKRLAVPAGKFAELCSALMRGQTVAWEFQADGATDFNIHYHVDKQVEYPERRERISDATGRLAVGVDQTYCWMWTNRSTTPVVLQVRLNQSR